MDRQTLDALMDAVLTFPFREEQAGSQTTRWIRREDVVDWIDAEIEKSQQTKPNDASDAEPSASR